MPDKRSAGRRGTINAGMRRVLISVCVPRRWGTRSRCGRRSRRARRTRSFPGRRSSWSPRTGATRSCCRTFLSDSVGVGCLSRANLSFTRTYVAAQKQSSARRCSKQDMGEGRRSFCRFACRPSKSSCELRGSTDGSRGFSDNSSTPSFRGILTRSKAQQRSCTCIPSAKKSFGCVVSFVSPIERYRPQR